MHRRASSRPLLNPRYKGLCSKSIPLDSKLFRKDIRKTLTSVALAYNVSQKVSTVAGKLQRPKRMCTNHFQPYDYKQRPSWQNQRPSRRFPSGIAPGSPNSATPTPSPRRTSTDTRRNMVPAASADLLTKKLGPPQASTGPGGQSTPHCPDMAGQPWFPVLLKMIIAPPLVLLPERSLSPHPHTPTSLMLAAWVLFASDDKRQAHRNTPQSSFIIIAGQYQYTI
ncbi:uncharacterized protein [Diadema antillarum]|uniref:uncharacterized protein n=1 Tax=Diadema antillarum TaxID=105358 RepID=UPI003A87466B